MNDQNVHDAGYQNYDCRRKCAPRRFQRGCRLDVVQQSNHGRNSSAYSFNSRAALAFSFIREKNSEFYIPRADFLLKRWNQEDSQANIYLSFGAGTEKFASSNYNAKLAELVTDWEPRKYHWPKCKNTIMKMPKPISTFAF